MTSVGRIFDTVIEIDRIVNDLEVGRPGVDYERVGELLEEYRRMLLKLQVDI